MGIFSFFSRRDEEDEDLIEEEEEKEPQAFGNLKPAVAATGKLYDGMKLDVTTKEGELLFTGKLTTMYHGSLTLNRLPGELSFKIIPLNSEVHLNGFDKKMLPISLSATVEESSRVVLKVNNIQVESHAESRDNFRLPYSAPITIFRYDDAELTNPEECMLVNISITGCCIQSDYVHMEDEIIRIHMKLEEYTPLDYIGQVVRCSSQVHGKFKYGILFAQLSEMESMTLSKMLYNLQTGNRNVHTRTSLGHW